MKISVFVKTRSKQESVEKRDDGNFVVRVNALPVDNEANERVIELLSEHFQVARSQVQLVSGQKSKNKVFAINRT